MNKIPIDSNDFEKYIKENKLFERAKESLTESLKNRYEDSPEQFIEDMFAPFDKVMKEYKFVNKLVEVNKNLYFYEPHDYYLSIDISVFDEKGSYVGTYTLFLDFNFEVIDDWLIVDRILRTSKIPE
jgi:hypothetical protein